MNTVSNTAYYCCGVRMLDAEHPNSLCHDSYAKCFMDENGMQIFEPFRSETMPNISNTVRCYLIDQLLQEQLTANPDALVITIGSGFDTRPYRLNGGHWFELDEPAVMTYKEQKLPASECRQPLTRLPIRFANERIIEKLSMIHGTQRKVLIVIEGVLMYLDEATISTTLTQLKSLFPQHALYCDLMSNAFFRDFAYKIHEKLVAAGGEFTPRPEQPNLIFKEHTYQESKKIPIFPQAAHLGLLKERAGIPKPIAYLMYRFLKKSINGYTIHAFDYR